ncbi:MAG: sulfite exporter TauE/SafE family protein [Melioribacteraceae bacterium]|nr:sulfite exporter TauE/SafE family protein [Melioribacteraceae bacterium]MCF8263007.1 sulfite exporter TauE/SafE family protein [Melioribacteraceae bacterium]MCF8430452.1 sulfite exporter TauE/SafE family protein [Melioribacteraceae bacterium]
MDSLSSILILFFVGVAAGFINVNAGGGSTLTLPTLIFLGLDASIANGTNRVAIFLQNGSAIYSFRRENYSEFGLSLKMSLFTIPGAVLGAIISTKLSNETFEFILGIVMILIILTMLIPNKKKNGYEKGNEKVDFKSALALIGIGLYGGFIQVGVGFIVMASLKYLMKMNLIYVNMHKVFIILFYTFPAILIFLLTDNINWYYGLTLAAGMATGAWWAAKFAVKKGEKLIKIVLMVAVFIMSLKLLGLF